MKGTFAKAYDHAFDAEMELRALWNRYPGNSKIRDMYEQAIALRVAIQKVNNG